MSQKKVVASVINLIKMRKTGYVVTIVVYGFIEGASIWMMT
jgi:hypothetical protein